MRVTSKTNEFCFYELALFQPKHVTLNIMNKFSFADLKIKTCTRI